MGIRGEFLALFRTESPNVLGPKPILPGPALDPFGEASPKPLLVPESMQMDRTAYMKDYRAAYKKRVKIVKVTLSMPEFARLKASAGAEGMKPATFARECVLATMEREARIPSGIQAELNAFRYLVRNISNNINQLAHHSNTIKRVSDERGVFRWLKALEGHVADYTSGKLK